MQDSLHTLSHFLLQQPCGLGILIPMLGVRKLVLLSQLLTQVCLTAKLRER